MSVLAIRRRFRRDYVGHHVVDAHGKEIGTVMDTWPDDGGGEVELMLVKTRLAGGRFAQRRWLPVEGCARLNHHLFLPHTLHEIEDSPDAEDHRWGRPADIARAHWSLMQDD
jgi:hypothetical protein